MSPATRNARISAGLFLMIWCAACRPGGEPTAGGAGEAAGVPAWSADGSNRRTILGGGQSWYPRWSPDGRWLVYTAAVPGGEEGDLDVYAVEVDAAGEPITLAGGPGREAEGRWRR
jgi:hypothetical protein